MRFQQLEIPAFGPFTDFSLTFPRSATDFHLIYGPNEAGKSSLLRAIQDLLFGIHGQTSDGFLHEYKLLRLVGEIHSRQGASLRFQRRKGTKNTLMDADGQPLADDALESWLGSVDRDFFSSMFGLGADQLRSGATALLQGQGELGQALFSASMAGTPVHRVLEELERESALLFKGAAHRNVSIRPAVARYREAVAGSRTAVVRAEQWEDAQKAVDDADQGCRRLQDQLKVWRTRQDWLQRCLDALPVAGQLEEQEQMLASRPVLPEVPPGFHGDVTQVLQRRERTRQDAEAIRHRIQKLQETLSDNTPATDVLMLEPQIEAAHELMIASREWQAQWQQLEIKLGTSHDALLASMRELGLEGEPASVALLRGTLEEEWVLEDAARRLEETQSAVQQAEQQIAAEQFELQTLQHQLDSLPEADVVSIRQAIADSDDAADAARRLNRLTAAEQAAGQTMRECHASLDGAPSDHVDTTGLPVPAVSILRAFEKETQQQAAELVTLQADLKKIEQEIRRKTRDRNRLDSHGTLPSVEQLLQTRAERDALWNRILTLWPVGDAPPEPQSEPELTSQPSSVRIAFSEAMARADQMADQLRDQAALVAQADELRLRIAELEDDRQQLQRQIQVITEAQAETHARWTALWSNCGITPLSAAEMLEWREHWMRFRSLFESWKSAQDDCDRSRRLIEEAENRLQVVLPHMTVRSLLPLRDEALRLVREADEARGARRSLADQQKERQASLRRIQSAQPALVDQALEARRVWSQHCSHLNLPDELRPEAAIMLLRKRRQLIADVDQWNALQRESQALRDAIADGDLRITQLSHALQVAAASVEVREATLWSLLTEARRRRTLQARVRTELDDECTQLQAVEQSLADAMAQLEALMRLADVADEEALPSFLQDLLLRQQTQETISHLRDRLHMCARGEPLETFLRRVREEDPASLPASLAEGQVRIRQADEQLQGLQKQLFAAEAARAVLEQAGDEAARQRQQAELMSSGIQRDARRYLRLQLAVQFLRQQIDEFRRQNQQPLLSRASELFRIFTEGSFDGLATSFDQNDQPILTGRRSDRDVEIAGMSEGTRDQLYLALRLSAIELHQTKHEPMPVILDDLLMTFDDQRAQAILPVLSQLGASTQVLLFTHHEHLLGLADRVLTKGTFHIHRMG